MNRIQREAETKITENALRVRWRRRFRTVLPSLWKTVPVRRKLLLSLGMSLLVLACVPIIVIGTRSGLSMVEHTGSEVRDLSTGQKHIHQVEDHPIGPVGEPLLAVVGASISAGVGAGTPARAWPEDLARMFGWRVVVSADPGAGFIALGNHREGPFSRLAGFLDFRRLDPKLILIQGGHNDVGQPLGRIAERVRQLVTSIHSQAPNAQLGLVSVFNTGTVVSSMTLATDRTIIAAAKAADPRVLVFDPIGDHWHYPRIGDHLHPTAAGHLWIARQLAAMLARDGVTGLSTPRVRDLAAGVA